ncbi:MAG: type II 3-dehydroquinate dehydratase [Inquilinaceae bacterium]
MLSDDATILILNGPNLNMLGVRQPDVYGTETLADVEAACTDYAEGLDLTIDFRQSNHEGELIGWVHEARNNHDGLIVNAGAYSHTSLALLDALQVVEVPIVEVHLTNVFRREAVRHHSYISLVAVGVICGFGNHGYLMALDAMARLIDREV